MASAACSAVATWCQQPSTTAPRRFGSSPVVKNLSTCNVLDLQPAGKHPFSLKKEGSPVRDSVRDRQLSQPCILHWQGAARKVHTLKNSEKGRGILWTRNERKWLLSRGRQETLGVQTSLQFPNGGKNLPTAVCQESAQDRTVTESVTAATEFVTTSLARIFKCSETSCSSNSYSSSSPSSKPCCSNLESVHRDHSTRTRSGSPSQRQDLGVGANHHRVLMSAPASGLLVLSLAATCPFPSEAATLTNQLDLPELTSQNLSVTLPVPLSVMPSVKHSDQSEASKVPCTEDSTACFSVPSSAPPLADTWLSSRHMSLSGASALADTWTHLSSRHVALSGTPSLSPPAYPAEPNLATANPAESNLATANPAESHLATANPAESNLATANPAESNLVSHVGGATSKRTQLGSVASALPSSNSLRALKTAPALLSSVQRDELSPTEPTEPTEPTGPTGPTFPRVSLASSDTTTSTAGISTLGSELCPGEDEAARYGQVAQSAEPLQAVAVPVSPESVVLEAWEVVNSAFLDARHKGWSQEAWEVKKTETLKRPIRSRMAAYSAISTMLASLEDPYSRFITPDQFASLAKYDVTGIGLNIGEEEAPPASTSANGSAAPAASMRLKVLGIVLGSPAQQQGMRQGDELLAVNGNSVEGLSAFEVSSLIQGPQGTPVTIQFRHSACSPLETATIARTVDVKTPVYYRLDRSPALPGDPPEAAMAVGYIRLKEFNARAKRDLVTAIERLQQAGAQSFTLDLQDNPGGLVQAGIEIARLFLPEGSTVIYTEGKDPSQVRSVMATGREITRAPITVLVNGRTASASEIVAAALHDNCRAVLVGGRTFGKGLIQSVYELSDGSGIILTVGKYVTPSHSDIDGNGIEPDFSRWPGSQKVEEKLGSCQRPELSSASSG